MFSLEEKNTPSCFPFLEHVCPGHLTKEVKPLMCSNFAWSLILAKEPSFLLLQSFRERRFSGNTYLTYVFNDFISFSPFPPLWGKTSIWVVVVTVLLSILVETFWWFCLLTSLHSSFNWLIIHFECPLISMNSLSTRSIRQ